MSELLFCIIIYYKDFCTWCSADLGQTSRFAASDLGLNGLPLPLLCDARHELICSITDIGKWFCSTIRYQMHNNYVTGAWRNEMSVYFYHIETRDRSYNFYSNVKILCTMSTVLVFTYASGFICYVIGITPIHAAHQGNPRQNISF